MGYIMKIVDILPNKTMQTDDKSKNVCIKAFRSAPNKLAYIIRPEADKMPKIVPKSTIKPFIPV
jgi:hypothetical protein